MGLAGAAIPAVAVGYGAAPAITIAGALLMSLMGTSALIRVWAALADVHGERRAIAMSEGEVSVSLAGILTPSLIAALAATSLSWRFAFLIGGATAVVAGAAVWRVGMPTESRTSNEPPAIETDGAHRWAQPTLLIVFAIVGLEFSLSFWLASLPIVLAATDIAVAIVGIAITGIGIGAMFPLTSSVHVKASRRSADSALGQVLAVASLGRLAGPLGRGRHRPGRRPAHRPARPSSPHADRRGRSLPPSLALSATRAAGISWVVAARGDVKRRRSACARRTESVPRTRPAE